MKHEWRKNEKQIYLPKNTPEIIDIPTYKFFMIKGAGNPNNPHFEDYISVLYGLSYGVKMSYKKGMAPEDYFDYTVYPLEGVWDLNEKAKKDFDGTWDKNDLVFNLMIRQPDFVSDAFAQEIIHITKKKKPDRLLDDVKFFEITEGPCAQMMHFGSYDDETASFDMMEAYCATQGYRRLSKKHREIYISDPRKVAPEKLKTTLRFQTVKNG